MRRLWWMVLLAMSGCVYAVPQSLFVTYEPDSAFDRVVQAVDSHCNGAKLINQEARTVMSNWQAWHTSEGVIIARCMVTLADTQTGTGGLDVRVQFVARECPLVDVDNLDAIADDCRAADGIPAVVGDSLNQAMKGIEADVRR